MIKLYMFLKVLLISNSLMFMNIHITSGSMEKTISTNAYIVCDKQIYKYAGLKRYDIVVFQAPTEENILYIKRIIGMPGEHIEISNGKIYINENEAPIKEDYLKEKWIVDNDGYVFDIPDNCYLLLGDNRNNSFDNRYWKNDEEKYMYVQEEKILARAMLQYFPSFIRVSEHH